MRELSTQTVVFTDLVGSTALRGLVGDDEADALLGRHVELVRGLVEGTHGRVVKSLGDGVMACFASAADAVDAGVALQQALHREAAAGQRLQLRIGIAAGDVREEGGDLFGTPVVEAARLCAAAAAGEVLVAELARLLARSRSRMTFEPLGDLELRGLPEPVPACRALWEPAAQDASMLTLPPLLAAAQASSYVGREALLEELQLSWKRARQGEHNAVLLGGEPGIGKTRTSAELARAVHAEGGVVLYGRCDEGLAAPYQPFVEALTGYVQGRQHQAQLGRLAGELRRLVPEIGTLVPGVGPPVETDGRSEEYRLFEAVTSWLQVAARGHGLLLVVDDLHWSTRPTLQLLLHVLRRLGDEPDARVLVVGTYRDTDVERTHPLVEVLADLRRLPGVTRLPLIGLDDDDVLQVLRQAAGHELDDAARSLAGLLRAETEGNPFFVGEVLRHLVESGVLRRVDDRWLVPDVVDLDIPEGVRDVVGRRVSRLSAHANRVLTAAAVIGREASLDVLSDVSGLDEDVVCAALDEGVRARLLHETQADHYRFSHALVRTTLYEELSATRRRRTHKQVADALERLHPDDVVSLAHHLLEAGPEGGSSQRAVHYALAAGRQGLEGRAPADAEVWFRHALELLEDGRSSDDRVALTAALGLGRAQHDQAHSAFRETLLDVSRRARDAGLVDLLVEAVLANQRGYASLIGSIDAERVALVEQALEAVGPDRTPTRARLLALLASEAAFGGDPVGSRRRAAEAVALAREVADPPTLAAVLTQVLGPSYDPDDLEGWARDLAEAAALADAIGDPAMIAMTRLFWSAADLARGDIPAARIRSEQMLAAANAASPALQWAAQAQAVRFVVAEQSPAAAAAANDACLALGEAAGEPDCVAWWASVGAAISVVRDYRISGLAEVAADYADRFPGALSWRATVALALAERGDCEAALEVVHRYDLTPSVLMEEAFPYSGPTVLGRVAFRCDDAELAEQTYRALLPHRGRWAHYYTALRGPVSGSLGVCALVLGRADEAVELLEDAVEQVRQAQLGTLLVPCELDLATVLQRRGAGGDRERVQRLCRDVLVRAEQLGCPGAADEARALLAGNLG